MCVYKYPFLSYSFYLIVLCIAQSRSLFGGVVHDAGNVRFAGQVNDVPRYEEASCERCESSCPVCV